MHKTRLLGILLISISNFMAAGIDGKEQPKGKGGGSEQNETKRAENKSDEKHVGAARKEFVNDIGMSLIFIPPGEFKMGSPEGEAGRNKNETQHGVKITKGFYLGKTEVTQAQWKAIMGTTVVDLKGKRDRSWPLKDLDENCPVFYVSWNDAAEFCEILSKKEKRRYRLPTEAEWEYACRAGTETPFNTGETISDEQANCKSFVVNKKGKKVSKRQQTMPAGSFPPNAWGLYDMHGNVWEWCQDRYAEYPAGNAVDPVGDATAEPRILRSGAWGYEPSTCRSASRDWTSPKERVMQNGFRVAMDFENTDAAVPDSIEPKDAKRPNETSEESPGVGLRKMVLSTPAGKMGFTPTDDFPRVYGVLTDWRLEKTTASIMAMRDGSASLYTTSTFGIIGGEAHEKVQQAAVRYVKMADRYIESSKSVTEFNYPEKGEVYFYLLTYDGVRRCIGDANEIERSSDPMRPLFDAAQNVLTELRLMAEKRESQPSTK